MLHYSAKIEGGKGMSAELTKEDIFRMFAETDRRLDRRFEETDIRFGQG